MIYIKTTSLYILLIILLIVISIYDKYKRTNKEGNILINSIKPKSNIIYGKLSNKYNPQTDKIGFIMLRHVSSIRTNKYWMWAYDSIRRFYPENKIVIIDDNSNNSVITGKNRHLYNTIIIASEYPKRGELLPYLYYLNNKYFDTAVIIHDSVFINRYINFNVDSYRFIWDFEHDWDNVKEETKMIKLFQNKELLDFYNNKKLWKGCFGGMTIINHDFLVSMNKKYDISKLLDYVVTRDKRKSFERVIACLLEKHGTSNESLLGDIHKYCKWGISIDEVANYSYLPITKVWTGR